MNELKLSNEVVQEQKTMTIREVANVLKVSTDTIYNIAKRLFNPSDLNRRVVNGGNAIVLTELQVTKIKLDLQKNKRISNTTNNIQTDLEVIGTAAKALSDLLNLYKAKESEYKATINSQQKQIETLQPKGDFYDAVTQSDSVLDMAGVAKVIGIPKFGRNNLINFLKEKKVFITSNRPYQKYVDNGCFKVVETKYVQNGETRVGTKVVAYQKGVDLVRKLLAA